MTAKNNTPIDIFSALLDGYSADHIAGLIRLDDSQKSISIAQKAVDSFLKEEPTPQDQKNVHEALQLIFDGDSAYDLEQDYSIDTEDAEAYMKVIDKSYQI